MANPALNSDTLSNGLSKGFLAQATQVDDGTANDDSNSPAVNAPAKVAGEFLDRVRGAGSDYDSAKARSDNARDAMIKAMASAGDRLRNMNFGPSEQEQNSSMAAAWSANTKTGRFGESMGNVYAQQAANAKAAREAELQKQQMLSQYGVGLAGAQYNQAQKDMADATGAARAFSGPANTNQRIVGQEMGKGYKDNGDGTFSLVTDGSGMTYLEAQNKAKLYGKPLMLKNADGTTSPALASSVVGGHMPVGNAPAQAPKTSPQTASAPPPQAPGSTPATPAAPPNPTAASVMRSKGVVTPTDNKPPNPYDVYTPTYLPNLPGNVFTSQNLRPAFERAADVAFSPQALSQFSSNVNAKGQGYGQTTDSKIQQKAIDKFNDLDKEKSKSVVSQASAGLKNIDEIYALLNSGGSTGAWTDSAAEIVNKAQQLGLLKPGEGSSLKNLSYADFGAALGKKLNDLTTQGLTTTYGSRVTNMDVTQALKSSPNPNMPDAAVRLMLKWKAATLEADLQANALKSKFSTLPGVDPRQFSSWYKKYLDPYSNSVVRNQPELKDADPINATFKNLNGEIPELKQVNQNGWALEQGKTGSYGYVNPHDRTQYVGVGRVY